MLLTPDLELVLHEHLRNLLGKVDVLGRELSRSCPLLPLPRAIVDQVLDPVRMLPYHGGPEEALVGAAASSPLVWQSWPDPWQAVGVFPDLVHSELRPVRDLDILGGVPLELHDLHLLEQLLHEVQGAVVLLREHEALESSW